LITKADKRLKHNLGFIYALRNISPVKAGDRQIWVHVCLVSLKNSSKLVCKCSLLSSTLISRF